MAEGGGLLLVLAGDLEAGAAAGMALRALGQGLDVLVCPPAGEGEVYRQLGRAEGLPGKLTVRACPGDTGEWLAALAGEVRGGRHDMVVVPSVERILAEGLEPELAGLVRARPPGLHLVLAGLCDLSGLVEEADLVTRFERRK